MSLYQEYFKVWFVFFLYEIILCVVYPLWVVFSWNPGVLLHVLSCGHLYGQGGHIRDSILKSCPLYHGSPILDDFCYYPQEGQLLILETTTRRNCPLTHFSYNSECTRKLNVKSFDLYRFDDVSLYWYELWTDAKKWPFVVSNKKDDKSDKSNIFDHFWCNCI